MRPRRAQTPVLVRSDFVAERLKELTAGGKSQATILEELVASASTPTSCEHDRDEETFRKLMEISERSAKAPTRFKSMAEFDAHEYDVNGNCR